MLINIFLALVSSKSYVTHIYIDGIPFQQFVSSKYEYFVSIPYSKNQVSIEATTSSALKPARIYSSDHVILESSTLKLNGFDTIKIQSGKKAEYTLHFVQVPSISDPVFVNTKKGILTPTEITSPLINSARIVGCLPNSTFHHYISTSGEKPFRFSSVGLPSYLSLDADKGIITGTTQNSAEITVKVTVTNKYGADDIELKIVVGQHQRLTPIMGWSSWYTQSHAISEEGVLKMAHAAVESRLNDYGYLFINIDDCWQGSRDDKPPHKLSPKKPFNKDGVQFYGFNDMKNMTNYIHSLGLKVGLYSGPKPSTYAGFLGSSSFNSSGMDYSIFSPNNGNTNTRGPLYDANNTGTGKGGNPGVYQPTEYFGSWFSGYESSPGGKAVGPFWFGDVDVQQMADWDFDFMKWDWCLYCNTSLTKSLTKTLSDAIVRSGRSMVLSLSNNVGHDRELMDSAKKLGATHARISTDITDNWFSMSAAAAEAMYFIDQTGGGFWPDPDMIQVGYLGNAGGLNVNYHKTHLAVNEQYFQMSFWAIFPAPMILSCDLTQIDDLTAALLKNREVIMINQDSLGAPAKKLVENENTAVVRKLSDGTVALGTFNYIVLQKKLVIDLYDVSKATGVLFPKGAILRNIWEQKDIGIVEGEFTINLDNHQGLLFKLIPIV